MSLKEPMTSCVPDALQSVLPSSHQHKAGDGMICNRNDIVPNFNHVLQQGTRTCGQISIIDNSKNSNKHLSEEFLQQHPKSLFGIHANSNFLYCHNQFDDGAKEITCNNMFNRPNTCTETQIRQSIISKEMEMHDNTMDTALPPLRFNITDLNESNSPHLSRCSLQQKIEVSFTSQKLKDESRRSPPTSQGASSCITRNNREPNANSDLASLNMESSNYRPLPYEYVPSVQSSLKSEPLTTKHNIYRGGKTNLSPPDLGITTNNDTTLNSLRSPPQRQQQQDQHQEQNHSLGTRDDQQVVNDTNRTTKYSFQQMQKQPPLVEMNPVASGGSFATKQLSTPPTRNNNNNTSTHSMMSQSSCTPIASSNPLYSYNHQQSASLNNTCPPPANSSAHNPPYSNNNLLMVSQPHHNSYRNLPSTISRASTATGSTLRDHDTVIQSSASSLLLLSEQKQPSYIGGGLIANDSARSLEAVAAVPVAQGCTSERIPTTQSSLHYSSIPHSSSSLLGKKQRMTSTITASTNIPQSSLNAPQQPTNPLSNNNSIKPHQTTNIKFHLLDDPNLKQDEHRSNFVRIDEEQIRKVFHLTQRQAAAFLGVSLSTLKRRFYEMRESLGMDKWPTTANGTTTIPATQTSACVVGPTNSSSSNLSNNNATSRNNKGSRKNSLQSDQTLNIPTTPLTNLNDNHSSYHIDPYNNASSRRTSVTSQDEFTYQKIGTPHNGNSSIMNQNNHSSYLPQSTNNLPAVNISLPPIVTSPYSNPTSKPQLPNNDSLDNFLSRYAPKSFDDIAQDSDKCLPVSTTLKRRTNVFGQGHDPILIAKMFSEETTTSNSRKRSYPNISTIENKEFEKDSYSSQLPRHSSFSSQGSMDGSFEPPRKVNKAFPINKRGSTDENAEPKTNNPSNMSFILNEGVKDPTHLDKEEWNTLMEAFKKQ
ncbi:hypothetical protein NAEGRDRAFT_58387 [Naegleria gruberi]|uniref:RWP-RK domain-containing protein n=1 Tax=Naegleria gruberi TaxID=5762 RepID=D2VJE9_NAEGR|nr:uncharacterized protein NAEGRDRAFT_58387 [Naegleria gruberi]EFC42930.1 hypothetical protein NAEGRDRAFT_58387 [Naegleria gruberi]|eukprot:XP_002675674.1 hypothetical protein NAEGRDRAFT_58387 [Naegleria gruberi strain NEG-M]